MAVSVVTVQTHQHAVLPRRPRILVETGLRDGTAEREIDGLISGVVVVATGGAEVDGIACDRRPAFAFAACGLRSMGIVFLSKNIFRLRRAFSAATGLYAQGLRRKA